MLKIAGKLIHLFHQNPRVLGYYCKLLWLPCGHTSRTRADNLRHCWKLIFVSTALSRKSRSLRIF